jgi:hypothetical protein
MKRFWSEWICLWVWLLAVLVLACCLSGCRSRPAPGPSWSVAGSAEIDRDRTPSVAVTFEIHERR